MIKILQKLIPLSVRNKLRKIFLSDCSREVSLAEGIFREMTSPIRKAPDFIIIGGQKCGTTALFQYLKEHPNVKPAYCKELYFFDNNFSKGINWYKSHFPLIAENYFCRLFHKINKITGEATPNYMFHPHAAKRIFKICPNAKLIVLLRNPIDRTYSQYQHNVRFGHEELTFEEALEKEEDRIAKETKKLIENKISISINRQKYSYTSRGLYADQLKVWFKYFNNEQILIIKSEDLFENPPETYSKILSFLELPEYKLKNFKKIYAGKYSSINNETREKLKNFFEPYNEKLYKMIGVNLNWK